VNTVDPNAGADLDLGGLRQQKITGGCFSHSTLHRSECGYVANSTGQADCFATTMDALRNEIQRASAN
jgi:hypothetical protein